MSDSASRPLCAITGSSGYVGSRLRDHFVGSGWDVLELVRRPAAGPRAVSFTLGEPVSPAAFDGVTALVHCAWDFTPRTDAAMGLVNVEGTRRLFDAARAAGVSRIVFISSISAFPGCRSRYGRAKLAAEQVATDAGAATVRPGLVFDAEAGGMFGTLMRQVRSGRVVPLVGDGSQPQYLVHSADLAAVVERIVADHTIPAALFTVAHSTPWRLRDVIAAIATALRRRVTFVAVPWQLVWAALRSAELLHVPLRVRSDSVVSLMHPDPHPVFLPDTFGRDPCRPFGVAALESSAERGSVPPQIPA